MLNLRNYVSFKTSAASCALLVALACPHFVDAQSSNQASQQQYQQQQPQYRGQGQPTAQQTQQQAQNQNYQTPQLTPQQRAAQQQAAMQSPAQQRAAQQAYMAEMQKKIVQPEGFPLAAEHTKYVDDLLTYWEQNSNAVSKYKCAFRRFEYDSGIVGWRDPQSNKLAAHTVAYGEIRFAAPDRARYETTRIMEFKNAPKQPGGQADYKDVEGTNNFERWICDGSFIYEFDFENKRLTETELPKEMRGNVAESPLPFIFGGKKSEVLQRYWVRSATPNGVENEYWLELYPKRAQDARIYSKIELVIAKEDFLPKAMHMYDAQYDLKGGNEKSRYFTFENRVVNNQLDKLKDAIGQFVKPKLPIGWKRSRMSAPSSNQVAAPPQLRQNGAQADPRQATGQQNGQPMRRQ